MSTDLPAGPAGSAAPAASPAPVPAAPDRRGALELARPVAARYMSYKYHCWHYPEGVTFLGLLYLTEATGETRYCEYVAGQIKNFHATRRLWGEPDESDPGYGAKQMAPGFRRPTPEEVARLGICPFCGAAARSPHDALLVQDDLSVVCVRPRNDSRIQNGIWLELYRQTKEEQYLDWQRAALAKMIVKQPDYTKRAGFKKLIDASFLPGITLARAGAVTGDRRYHDQAVLQLAEFTKLLRDPATGLFHQAWGWPTDDPDGYTPGHWGRGNGWIIGALIETLAFLPEDHPGRAATLKTFQDLCAALARYQDAAGMWHNVVARADSVPETSATGLIVFAYAKGARLGLLAPEYRARAVRGFAGLRRYVRPDGTVLNTCTGTGPAVIHKLADYYARPLPPNDPHGDGPVLLAASEIVRIEREEAAAAAAAERSPHDFRGR